MNSKTAMRIAQFVLCTVFFWVTVTPASAQSESRLYSYSTLYGLLAGVYDGELTVGELRGKGDFGLGTFNHLDGEMIVVDGVCYHAKADGTVSVADSRDKTPLAFVTRFHSVQSIRTERALSMPELEKWMDRRLPNHNLFYAIRIDGQFRDLAVRAIAPQTKPYKPLSEVVATQVVHNFGETRGVLVGIRSPAFSRGISVPGYHWHYLTEDRKHGGHLLKLTVVKASAQWNEITALDLQLPRNEAFAIADQTKDRSAEVKRVEGQ